MLAIVNRAAVHAPTRNATRLIVATTVNNRTPTPGDCPQGPRSWSTYDPGVIEEIPSWEEAVASLAAAAHACWCRSMAEQGWSPGPAFDPAQRRHDALVRFERLAAKDRLATIDRVASAGLARAAADLVSYDRGPARPFRAEDMRPGLAVVFLSSDRVTPLAEGRVESWEIDPASGELELIRVRWDDGSSSSHHPDSGELGRC